MFLKDGYNISKIIRKINRFEYVSFDIFDTLIKRNVREPSQIFDVVRKKFQFKYNKDLISFKKDRINAEVNAKLVIKNGEPNLDDIYLNMEGYTKEQKEELKKLEIETEKEYCQCNKNFKPIYDYCLKANKKIIIISDMYLSSNDIIQILKENNINNYIKLYVSNEYKCSKREGSLFEKVLEDLKIKNSELIHIGDSKVADYLRPKLKGIHSINIKKETKNTVFSKISDNENLDEDILYSYLNNNIDLEESTYYKLGYELLGPILYGYTNWIIEQFEKNKITNVFFLAREGNLLKKAFDILNTNKIKSHYLYCSRRSTRVPLLENINNVEDVFNIVKMRRIVDIESFFINVGLDIKNYDKLIEKYELYKSTDIRQNKYFDEFFNEIKEDIIKNAKLEEKNIIKYLEQEKFYGKVAVCDVGWIGTMQKALGNILSNYNINNEILGFYMGLNTECIDQRTF